MADTYQEPTPERIHNMCVALGGKTKVAKLLKKNYSTINRWCKTGGISYVDWMYMGVLYRGGFHHIVCSNIEQCCEIMDRLEYGQSYRESLDFVFGVLSEPTGSVVVSADSIRSMRQAKQDKLILTEFKDVPCLGK